MLRPIALCLCLLPGAAFADDIEDALTAAMEAYRDGDVSYAIQELDFARAKMTALKTSSLSAFLPEAPEGWTVELDEELGAALGMMGGGSGASAEYMAPNGDSLTITVIADSPMVAGIAGMMANARLMGASIERVGRQMFASMDGQLVTVVDNRIVVQAEGGTPETVIPLLESIDYGALADWGR